MKQKLESRRYLYLTAISLIIFFMLPAGLLWAAVPSAPSSVAATALSYSQIKLTWTDNSADETHFYIERKTGASGTYFHVATAGANLTAYTDTSVTGSTEYYYRVRAYNGGGYSAYSNETNATTPTLNAPSNLTVAVLSYSQIKLTWTDTSSDEQYFYIERKTGTSGTYSYLTNVYANTTTYTNYDSYLQPNTEYYYRVRAYNNSTYSAYSNEAGVTTPTLNAPSNLTATALSVSQIRLTWTDNSSDETQYNIERKIGASGTYSPLNYVVGANTTTSVDYNLEPNTEYYYRVRARGDNGYSPYSNEIKAATLPLNAPSNLTAIALSYLQIKLTWTNNSTEETSFYIERKTGVTGTYSYLTSVNANTATYTDTSALNNTEHYYRVSARINSVYSAYSNEAGATTPPLPMNAPSSLTATALPSCEIRLTWADNSGETSFSIERKIGSSGTYSTLTSVGGNIATYTDFPVSENTQYYYRVRAYNNSTYSAYSNEAGATTPIMALNAPSNLTAAALSSSNIKLTWTDNSAEEKGFIIERKTGASGTYFPMTYSVGANATTVTDSFLAPNTEYYYRVRAHGDGGYSPYSNGVGAATLPLNAPSNLTASALSYSEIKLTWTDNSSDEMHFYIERKTGASGTYSFLSTVGANTTTYTNYNLTQNTEYYYRVRAYNGGGYSANSNEAGATTPLLILSAPSNLTATALSSYQIKLTWTDNSSEETSFYLERKKGSSGTYSVVTNAYLGANSTIYTDTLSLHSTEYYYRVRAYNAGAYSPYSHDANAATLTLNAPSNLTAAALSSSEIKLTWTDNSPDEQYFYIERKTGASGSYSALTNVWSNTSTFTDTSALQNTEYYYRVRAYNNGGYSTYSNEAVATTKPLILNAPSNLTATALSHSQIKLTWTDNSSVEQYFYIERKTGASGTYFPLNSAGGNTTTYTDSYLTPNTEYYYRVRAYGAGVYSAYSNEVSATTLPLNAPSGLTAEPVSCSEMKLTWKDNSTDETYFYIERKIGEGGNYYYLTSVYANTTTYTHTGLTPDTKHYYRVRAYSSPNYSAYSNEASGTTIMPEGYELHSRKIALVPNAGGRYNYGGTLPTTFNCYAPTFVNVSAESIRDNATDPLVTGGYDTIVLVGMCDINSFLSNNRFKSRIENFVSYGGKLIIWDSECRGTDYSKFVFPFITSNPGQMGSTGVLADLEENTLSSKNTLSINYINVSYVSAQTTAVGDANVMVTQDPNWCIDMTAENYNGVKGPVHTYAQYGKGLIIYDGFDKTDLYTGQTIGTADGVQNLGKLWMLELKQAWNPVPKDPQTGRSVLPCLVPVVGIKLTPESSTTPTNKYHTLTAKVVDETWKPAPGKTVTFTVKSGPHAGTGGASVTDASGIATFSYKGIRAGVDSIEASATVSGNTVKSKTVHNEWIFALTEVRVIDTISNAKITVDELSISPAPYSISHSGDVIEIEWRYSYISIGEIQDLSFSVDLLDPVPGEDRLVNRKLVINYADVDGNPVMTELGPQYVHVLNSAFDGSISTDNPEYQPNENVALSASIKSHNEYAKTLDAKILIEDISGALVKEVAALPALNFSAGETKYLNDLVYNIGLNYAGNYRAHLILYENQKKTTEAFADFAIMPVKTATSSVTTDKVTYVANEAVIITSQIVSESHNYMFRNLTSKVTLFDNQGRGLFEDSKTIPLLTPGGLMTFESNWNISTTPKGNYTVKLELFEDASVVSSSQTTFDVLGTSQTGVGLTGTITAQTNPVPWGNSETLTYSVRNIGNEDMYNLALKVLVVDPDTQYIKHAFESAVNLNMGAMLSGQFVVSTSELQLKTYVVLMQYLYQGGTKTAATSSFVVQDGVAPVVSVVSPASGGIYTDGINIEVKAIDDSSGVKSAEYQIDGGAWRLLPIADLSTGRYMTAWTPSQVDEGPHAIRFRATDRAGNTGLAGPVSFTVQMDNIPPQTTLTVGAPKYEASGRIFVTGNTAFTLAATDNYSGVAKTEYRIDGGAWTPYAPFTISGEGPHAIYYRSTDNAGNAEPANILSVIVDNTPPSVNAGADIIVFAERDGTKTVTINATVADPEDFDRSPKITWTEKGIILGNSEDLKYAFGIGRHDLTLQSVDHLGNTASDSVAVTVMARQAGLTYVGDTEGHWSDTAVISVHASDITGAQAPVSLNEYGSVTFSILKDDVEADRYSVGATDSNGDAMTTHHFFRSDMPAGDYLVVVSFTDPSGTFAPATLEVPFRLNAAAGVLDYSGNQIVTVNEAGIQLQATLYQEEDEANGSLIDFDNNSNPVWVQFHIYKFTQIPGQDTPFYSPAPVRVRNSALHPSVGLATLFVPLSTLGAVEENYIVTMSLTDWSYIGAYPSESLLMVYKPDGRFFTGGGFILDPTSGRPNNFGFTFKYNKQGKPQGNIVYIIRNEEEGTRTRIKSNMLTSAGFLPGNPVGIPTAVAEGKCNVATYDLLTGEYIGGAGNLNFRLTVEDKGTSGIDQDAFYLRVLYPDGVPYEQADMQKSEILKGGNIVIHNTPGK